MTARTREDIAQAFVAACHAELQALKPGNVHIHAPGHGMDISHFEKAAAAAAPFIADPSLSVGKRILQATEASFGATGLNTNLGIVLLCAPLAKAAAETDASTGLRRRLAVILGTLTKDDADDAFAAIRIANPAGLGKVDNGDVTASAAPRMTLIEAMQLARDRDRIANAYVTAFEDIFDFALPVLDQARTSAAREDLAVSTLHMALLAEFPDSHIARKYGPAKALEVRDAARELASAWSPAVTQKSFNTLKEFDLSLKSRGLNPGTTADFVVATLFTSLMSRRKLS
ncbi:MAG: triphosphoribosyl-dephospho-CoA synthase [Hyphomicrobium sp.]